jgi:voltage-gated potassium channel
MSAERGSRGKRTRFLLRNAITAVALLGLYFVIPVPGDRGTELGITVLVGLVGLPVLAYIFLTIAERARRSPDDHIRLEALVAVSYVFVVFTSLIYVALASYKGQFVGINNRMDALYFTMSTIATVGFGDVHATGTVSRAVVTVQIAADLVIVGLVARIILPSVVSGRDRLRASQATDAAPEARDESDARGE